MRSLSNDPGRHTVIDRRDGHYLCFPDVLRTGKGRLLVPYTETDQHGRTRQKLLLKRSDDGGRTWSAATILHPLQSQCPRIAVLADGQITVIDDHCHHLFWSGDDGASWCPQPIPGFQHFMMDRLLELDPNTLLTAAHTHRGIHPQPGIGQGPTEVMAYLSRDRGATWKMLSVIAADKHLALCEISATRLPDGRLLALMRENSFVHEPMYACLSDDGGRTWSDPAPTPLVGHRPTVGTISSGRLLVTYRNTGPNGATSAWLGTLGELLGEYQVHGLSPIPPESGPDGLILRSTEGRARPFRYALRPITDPRRARAVLEVRARVVHAGDNGFGLRFGGAWFRIGPDAVAADAEGTKPVAIPAGRMNDFRLEYDSGKVRLQVNGKKVMGFRHPPGRVDRVDNRPVLVGNADRTGNEAEVVLQSMRLRIREPRLLRDYTWQWDHGQGLPDAWTRERVLELKNCRLAHFGDYGYSGWTELEPGRFLCVYHHVDAEDEGYKPDFGSYVMGTFFGEEDFG